MQRKRQFQSPKIRHSSTVLGKSVHERLILIVTILSKKKKSIIEEIKSIHSQTQSRSTVHYVLSSRARAWCVWLNNAFPMKEVSPARGGGRGEMSWVRQRVFASNSYERCNGPGQDGKMSIQLSFPQAIKITLGYSQKAKKGINRTNWIHYWIKNFDMTGVL